MAAVEKSKPTPPQVNRHGVRPGTKISKKLVKEITDRVAKGVSLSLAARASGVAPNTAFEWDRRGRGEDTERPRTPMTELFAVELDKALGRFAETHITYIAEHEDWKARGWLMERRFPEEYGRPADRVELTGVGGGPIEIKLAFDASPIAARSRAELGGPVIDVEAEEIL